MSEKNNRKPIFEENLKLGIRAQQMGYRTVKALANAIGANHKTVTRVFRDEINAPILETKLAKALDVSVAELFALCEIDYQAKLKARRKEDSGVELQDQNRRSILEENTELGLLTQSKGFRTIKSIALAVDANPKTVNRVFRDDIKAPMLEKRIAEFRPLRRDSLSAPMGHRSFLLCPPLRVSSKGLPAKRFPVSFVF